MADNEVPSLDENESTLPDEGFWTLEEKCGECGSVIETQTNITDSLRNAIIMAIEDKPSRIKFTWIRQSHYLPGT